MVLCLQLLFQSLLESAPAKVTLVLAAALSAQLASLQTSATWMIAVLARHANEVGSMQIQKDELDITRTARALLARTARGRKRTDRRRQCAMSALKEPRKNRKHSTGLALVLTTGAGGIVSVHVNHAKVNLGLNVWVMLEF